MSETIVALALIALTAWVAVREGSKGHAEPGENAGHLIPPLSPVPEEAATDGGTEASSSASVVIEPSAKRTISITKTSGSAPGVAGPAHDAASGLAPSAESDSTPGVAPGVLGPGPSPAPWPTGVAVDLLPKPAARNGESRTIDLGLSPSYAPFADPDRLIQSEIIVPTGPQPDPMAVGRLFVAIVGFGVLLGIGIIVAFRTMGFFFRAIVGG